MSWVIRSIAWRWDKQTCICWADVVTTDGQKLSVGLPLAHVAATFDACAAEVGLMCPPMVGAADSVDGLFSAIKKIGKAAVSAAKSTTKVLTKAVNATVKVVNSKYTNFAIKGLTVVFPAVGAAALSAQAAAKRAQDAYAKAKQAKAAIQLGAKVTSEAYRNIARGGNIMRNAQNAYTQMERNPTARLAVAALKGAF